MGNAPKTLDVESPIPMIKYFSRYWPLLLAAALFLVAQWPLLKNWWVIWNAPYSYFSHGPLVPFIAGYMVWANRKRLASTKIEPCWAGYILLAFSVLLFVLGNWTLAASLRAAVFVLMAFGILLSLLGARATKLLAVPVAFLLSMIPISPTLLDSATVKLQWQSAALSAKILSLTGYQATLSGATIYADGLPEPLIVGVPCSGLRTLISLLTFTVFFVYIVRSPWWKKAVLLAVSFPLSLFVNSLRITMIGYAGMWTGSATAMHKFHDYSGYIGLLVCFILLFGLAKLLKVESFGISSDTGDQEPLVSQRLSRVVGGGIPGIIVCCILALAAYSNLHASPIYPTTKGRLVRANIPMRVGAWTGHDLPIEKLVRDWLKAGDLLSRMYTDNSEYGNQIQVFMTASRDPAGFHDPHMCLPGGGTPISGDRFVTLRFQKPYPTSIRATLLTTNDDYGESLVMYWYMSGRDSMPITGDVWTLNRKFLRNDAIRLMLNPWKKNQIKKDVESRQYVWFRFSTQVAVDEQTSIKELERFAAQFIANLKGFGEM